MRFSPEYSEIWRDREGEEVLFRMVRGEDRGLFVEGLRRLSPISIYNRFMTVKSMFTENELRYLTEPSGDGHIGIVAIKTEGGREVLVGVGRAARLMERPEAMDFGLIIADCEHRRGIGRALLTRLAYAAKERGAEFLVGQIFATNTAMFQMIDTFLAPADWVLTGPVAHFEIELIRLPGVESLFS